MATKVVVQTVAIKLVCPACNQILKNPKYLYLSCNHSYCEACLEKIWQQPEVTCLECGERMVFPVSGGAKRLPCSFFIIRLLDEPYSSEKGRPEMFRVQRSVGGRLSP